MEHEIQELFTLFQNKKNDFELFQDVVKLIHKANHNSKGTENAKFYEVLRKLTNSINNAGHEERRSDDISFINSEMNIISDLYEDFLP